MVPSGLIPAFNLLLCTWFVSHTDAATLSLGVPSSFTIIKARCYANCFTLTGSYNNESEKTCETPACRECLRPCEESFSEESCIPSCNTSATCIASCRFLTVVKNFSSIYTGDGSVTPQPDIPTDIVKNISSVTLQWSPVFNISGTPVYLIGMTYSGDATSQFPVYFSKIFTSPRATLTTDNICSLVRFFPARKTYQGIVYRFRVAILTENSSVSYGQYTMDIAFPKPNPVSNVTLRSFVFDASQMKSQQLILNASWIPSDQDKHLISKYAMSWDDDWQCTPGGLLRTAETSGPQASGILKLNEELRKCTHELQVFALVGCTPSDPVTVTYEYPGCLNVTDFPRELCYTYDPPDSPLEDREVSNISHHIAAVTDVFRFHVNVTWDPPIYPYRQVLRYSVFWLETGNIFGTSGASFPDVTHALLNDLLPTTNYTVIVQPIFKDDARQELSRSRTTTFITPAVDPNEVQVRSLTSVDFTLSPEEGTFSLNVTWQKPSSNYSEISAYDYSYRLDTEENETMAESNETHFIVSGISFGEPVFFKITPRYKHYWITGTEVQGETSAPQPVDEEIVVRDLVAGEFIEDRNNNTYSINFTWEPPSFSFSQVLRYKLSYELLGYNRDQLPCQSARGQDRCTIAVKTTFIEIPGIFPHEFIRLEVTPVYVNRYLRGRAVRKEETSPEPREELVKVVGLTRKELMPSSKDTFRATIEWQKPPFKHSEVKYYLYNTSVKNGQERRRRAVGTTVRFQTNKTSVIVDGINPDKEFTFEVTPVFTADVVSGRSSKLLILPAAAGASKKRTLSPGEVGGLVVGLLLLFVILVCLMIWCKRERKMQKRSKGLITGKYGLMVDDWEVDPDIVCLEEELGEGAFGKVYKGSLKEFHDSPRKLHHKPWMIPTRNSTIKQTDGFIVAVKMLHDMADSDQKREFLEEIRLMKEVGCHRNIINMIGCCTLEEPMFLLVEYVPYGDLLHYLRKHRGKVKEYLGDDSRGPYRSTYCETYLTDSPVGKSVKTTRNDRIYVDSPETQKQDSGNVQLISSSSRSANPTGEDNISDHAYVNSSEIHEESKVDFLNLGEANLSDESEENEESLSPGDLMAFAWQISQGMEYLAKRGFVHRDLAARNVLVGEKKIAKIADFGLTRHVYEEKVYHSKHNRKLPLKWMSLEAIFDETFTSQSDVWAFGVVLWELVTLGGTPYPSINNRELLKVLQEGYRMEKPETCNDELYELMTDCWKEKPEERPNFTLLRERLEQMMQKDNPYLDFSVVDESKDYYQVPSFNSLMEESTDDLTTDDHDVDGLSMKTEKDSEDSCKYEIDNQPENMQQIENKQIRETFELCKNLSLKNSNSNKDFKDAKITLSDIEMNLYKPGKRGLAF